MKTIFAVAVGGALGSVCRLGVNVACARWLGVHNAWGTFFVNAVGCFLIGLLAGSRFGGDPMTTALLATGFLGGLTTFSSFALETLRMQQSSQAAWALANVAANVIVGLICVGAGLMAGRRWWGL